MTLTVRPFRNTDLSAVCEIWNRHHAESSWNFEIQPDRMELFVQSKPYFEPHHLLLAYSDDEPVGFVHLGPLPDGELELVAPGQIGIAALCIVPHATEDLVAEKLLEAAQRECGQSAADRCVFRPALPECSFYLGLGPADSLAGTLASEQRTCRWLSSAGFQPSRPTTVWEIDLQTFRAPSDRTQMMVRRKSFVIRLLQEPELPWWQACVLGHTEVLAFRLTDRVEKREILELILWSIAPPLSPHPARVTWFWPPDFEIAQTKDQPELTFSDYLLFLLSESLRELQAEKVDIVRVVTPAESNKLIVVLKRLGFASVGSGMVFERSP